MKFTATVVRSLTLPSGKRDYIEFDDDVPGFGIRIREGGSRVWVFQYKLGNKQRRMTLGSVKALDVGRARETAKDLHAAVRLGRDPAAEKGDARVKAAETFEAAVRLFLEFQKARLRPRSYPDVERHLIVHARALHNLQLAKVSRRDIATCIAAVAQNSGAVTGNRVRTSLSTLFAWGVQQGLIDSNPVIGTARNQERPRDRVLEPAELRLIWRALGSDDFGNIIKLLALTGQRAGEIAGLRWSEVRDDLIVLPGERTKNHRLHTVPLTIAVWAILDAQPRRPGRDLVFGNGEGPFSGWSSCKERLDARIAAANGKALPHWTPHDLRRTAATMMAELGIQPHIVECVLNHASGFRAGVSGTYNRTLYEPEKRQALDMWADHLLAIVESRSSNVTSLKRA